MGQQITTLAATAAPGAQPEALRHLVETLKSRLIRIGPAKAFLPADVMPTGVERSLITTHIARIDRALAPAPARDIRIEVAKNFTVMSCRSPAGEDDIRGQQMLYVEALDDLPLSAIRQACMDYRKGVVGDGKWAPTPAEIRSRAVAILAPMRAELRDLRALLAAEPLKIAPPMADGADRLRGIVRGVVRGASTFPPRKKARDLRSEPEMERDAEERLKEIRYADRPVAASPELQQSKPFSSKDVSI